MLYEKPELEVIEFDEKVLTDGILASQEGVGEGNIDELPVN